MGLTDFWDNITTPGFLSASFEELKEICTDFKDEMQDLAEEGVELFTDGCKEMLFNGNSNYKTSIKKITYGKDEVNNIKKKLFAAKGINDVWQPVVDVLEHEFKLIIKDINEFEESGIKYAIYELQNEFKHLIFKMPDELMKFQYQVTNFFKMPDTPKYQLTSNKHEQNVEYGLISNKRKRVIVADKYLVEVEKYKEQMEFEIKKQLEAGHIFDTTVMSNNGHEFIVSFGCSYWELNLQNTASTEYFDMITDDVDVKANKKKKLYALLMLAAGIHSVTKCVLTMSNAGSMPVSDELWRELKKLKGLIQSLVEEDKYNSKNIMSSLGQNFYGLMNFYWMNHKNSEDKNKL